MSYKDVFTYGSLSRMILSAEVAHSWCCTFLLSRDADYP